MRMLQPMLKDGTCCLISIALVKFTNSIELDTVLHVCMGGMCTIHMRISIMD